MNSPPSTQADKSESGRSRRWPYLAAGFLMAVGTFGCLALVMNIYDRKQEARQFHNTLVDLTQETTDPQIWGINFPRQYDSYIRTVDTERTQYGGSEALAPSRLEANPLLKRFFAGYPFSVDFREARGHAWMLEDQDISRRTTEFRQTGACLHCHSSVMPAYREAGNGDVMEGFRRVCAMPLEEARQLVEHPVSCIDCHDPETASLQITRPAFLLGLQALAKSDDPLPHLPSIERWRTGQRTEEYDPNQLASRQEMRSFVCGQCHVEYYFQGPDRLVTYPWNQGLKAEQIESYYDEQQFHDWVHEESKARLIKAQHPEFEMWSQGIHARSGVACADCHMPYRREGAIKVSDHHVRSPMLNTARACQTCHRTSEAELLARVNLIQDRTLQLQHRAQQALVDLLDAVIKAEQQGVPSENLETARQLHRRAHWRMDFCDAENSRGFHASQETARILGEAIDYARQGQTAAILAMP